MTPLKLTTAVILGVALLASAAPRRSGKYTRAEAKTDYRRPDIFPFPKESPYSKTRADLGKILFFDPRLSSSGTISCASCHKPQYSWTDSNPTSAGVPGTPLARRSPTILNLAWAESLFWDGRANSLEEQALGPLQAEAEMNSKLESVVPKLKSLPQYAALFKAAYPAEGITGETIGSAIATFERTIVSGIAPFDEWVMGDEAAISETAKHGFDLYNTTAQCSKCHGGWNFTDGAFHDLGLEGNDLGRGRLIPQVEAVQHAFKTPTLRNVSQRPPYFHDGSARTLEAVVDHYDKGPWQKRPSLADEMKNLKLSDSDKRDLIDFLKTLTGNEEPVSLPVLPN